MFKGRHFDQPVILLCVCWSLGYNLSLRDLEEMMPERQLSVDHSTVHRWVIHFSPQLPEWFHKRKRVITGKWHIDGTCIKVHGRSKYLDRPIDNVGDTVEFFFSENRNLSAAKRFDAPAQVVRFRRYPDIHNCLASTSIATTQNGGRPGMDPSHRRPGRQSANLFLPRSRGLFTLRNPRVSSEPPFQRSSCSGRWYCRR
jgi:hypothetical protein